MCQGTLPPCKLLRYGTLEVQRKTIKTEAVKGHLDEYIPQQTQDIYPMFVQF